MCQGAQDSSRTLRQRSLGRGKGKIPVNPVPPERRWEAGQGRGATGCVSVLLVAAGFLDSLRQRKCLSHLPLHNLLLLGTGRPRTFWSRGSVCSPCSKSGYNLWGRISRCTYCSRAVWSLPLAPEVTAFIGGITWRCLNALRLRKVLAQGVLTKAEPCSALRRAAFSVA